MVPSEREAVIKLFEDNWEVDCVRHEIKYKGSFLCRFIDRVSYEKYTLEGLYAWYQRKWGTVAMLPETIPLKKDDIYTSPENRKYQLTNGWGISKKDLKLLSVGMLVGENNNILIEENKFKVLLKPVFWFFLRKLSSWG